MQDALQPALRILVVGDSSAAGVGVDDQAQALAQPVAKLLAIKLGRPITWQLVAKSGVNTEESLALLRQSELGSADFLVIALGTNDVTSQRAPRQFLQDYRRLVEEVRRRTGIVGLVATGLPPLRILPAAQHPLRWYLGRYAARLDRMLQRWISQDAAARYVSLDWAAKPLEMARDRFHPGAR
ncbi:SGNH/GDSL hydrolase family protein [Paraburkholderia sediminicola]|uniref:SGNH/GDSL hydrolase family protein n=3 Tax=Paraburkholderia TaxID=1822464 RepID=UPI0038BDF38C